jgi:uncharacterized membrane protein
VELPLADSIQTRAYAISNANIVVGIAQDRGDDELSRLVSWTQETTGNWTMDRLGVHFGVPSDINDRGEIAGIIREPAINGTSRVARPFVLQAGVTTMLPTLGGPGADYSVRVTGINDDGLIVGNLDQPDGSALRGVLWETGEPIVLESLGGNETRAEGIDSHGRIVGKSLTREGDWRACIWIDRAPQDLNTRYGEGRAALVSAGAINDEGVILAATDDPRSSQNLVVLFPGEHDIASQERRNGSK